MAHDVFISYSSHDKAYADAVCAGLELAGLRCWIAPRDIGAGKTYAGEIVAAIKGSKAMVVIFSSHSNASQQVMREVERAVNAAVAIVPFRIEDVKPTADMEYFLSVPHWLDALTPPLEAHIERLRVQVRALVGAAGSEGAKPPFDRGATPPRLPGKSVREVHPDEWSKKDGGKKGFLGKLFDVDS